MTCVVVSVLVGVLVGWNTTQPALVKGLVDKVTGLVKAWFGKL